MTKHIDNNNQSPVGMHSGVNMRSLYVMAQASCAILLFMVGWLYWLFQGKGLLAYTPAVLILTSIK
jgi:hypothetical protein